MYLTHDEFVEHCRNIYNATTSTDEPFAEGIIEAVLEHLDYIEVDGERLYKAYMPTEDDLNWLREESRNG